MRAPMTTVSWSSVPPPWRWKPSTGALIRRDWPEACIPCWPNRHGGFTCSPSVPAKRFSAAALRLLAQMDFPGNVRQLENLCRRLAVIAPGREIQPQDLTEGSGAAPVAAGADWTEALAAWAQAQLAAGTSGLHAQARALLDRTLLETALAQHQGHRQHAAAALGLGRNTLTRKLGSARRRRSRSDRESP